MAVRAHGIEIICAGEPEFAVSKVGNVNADRASFNRSVRSSGKQPAGNFAVRRVSADLVEAR